MYSIIQNGYLSVNKPTGQKICCGILKHDQTGSLACKHRLKGQDKGRMSESFFELSRLVGQVRFSKERDDRLCTEFVVKGLWLDGAADE